MAHKVLQDNFGVDYVIVFKVPDNGSLPDPSQDL
jgi:hypothetical protein